MATPRNKKRLLLQAALLLFLITATVYVVRQQRSTPYQSNQGFVFGTVYNITYQHAHNLQADIEAELQRVDCSLSPFNKQSTITHINNNDSDVPDSLLTQVFTLAQQVAIDTNGAFDITVAPLVNAWGFGFKHDTQPTPHTIDSLLQITGHQKVTIKNGRIVKADPRLTLDCSAIAKGYGTDRIASLLRQRGVTNFMVEIGGEIVAQGVSPKRQAWKIGVTKPQDDSLSVSHELQTVLAVNNVAMATSGNYRNFYYKDGKKYAHTIDPKTGHPVQHNILSATVIAPSCATADAYATAFMVMGLERAQGVLRRHPELQAYFIYDSGEGHNAVWFSPQLRNKIAQ